MYDFKNRACGERLICWYECDALLVETLYEWKRPGNPKNESRVMQTLFETNGAEITSNHGARS